MEVDTAESPKKKKKKKKAAEAEAEEPVEEAAEVRFDSEGVPQWGASFRWSYSLYCLMRTSEQFTIGKTRPTLEKIKIVQKIFSDWDTQEEEKEEEGFWIISLFWLVQIKIEVLHNWPEVDF